MLSHGLTPVRDRLGQAGLWLLTAAASLGAGMLAVGVVAWAALESILADTYNVEPGWHSARRLALAADLAATFVLTALTIVVLFAARRATADRGRRIAGILALALVLACALPSAGWFWLIAQDGLPSDAAFVQDAYGRWYFPVVGAFGAAYALAAAGAAVLLLLPRPHPAPAAGTDPWAHTLWTPPDPLSDPPTLPDLWATSTSGPADRAPTVGAPAEPPTPPGPWVPLSGPASAGGRGDGPAHGERLP